VELLFFPCFGVLGLLSCAILAACVAKWVEHYLLGRCVQRALTVVPCPTCGATRLAVTPNPLWPEQDGCHCCLRIPGRYACCRVCGAAFFACPKGMSAADRAKSAGSLELVALDAVALRQGVRHRRTAFGRLAALLGGAAAGLGVVYGGAPLCGLPARESVVVVGVACLVLLGRRLPRVVGRPQRGQAV